MRTRPVLFFWLGGVLTETLAEALARALAAAGGATLDMAAHLRLRAAADAVALGQMSGSESCAQASALCGGPPPADVEAALIAGLALRREVLAVLNDLRPGFEPWLLVDLPRPWCAALLEQPALRAHFPPERWIDVPALGLARLLPDIFYCAPHHVRQPMERCLLVDAVSARAVAAVRHGFSAELFVDAHRLRRQFGLRQMFATQPASPA